MSATLKNVYAPLPATKRGTNILPGKDPKGNNILYTCGSTVIIRNLKNPAVAELYNDHTAEATVARYAPSGFYIASADVTGKLKIWDTTQAEHLCKYEYQPLSGAIKDLVWSEDSKRIAVGGDGREKFGAAILWDSGSSIGDISGHSKCINSIDWKQTRPYRLVTGSEDCATAFFAGPPFKFQNSKSDHQRFVNVTRFSPDGAMYATASSDGQVFLYDGKTSDLIGPLGSPAHKGSIMGLAWSPDSKQILTASADKSAKLWEVEGKTCVKTFTFGSTVDDQQLGCLWQGDDLITISLSGNINFLDLENPEKPRMVVQGHNKPITAMTVADHGKTLFSADYSGRIIRWDVESSTPTAITGTGHTNQVNTLVAVNNTLWSAGMDDAILATPTSSSSYTDAKTPTEGCPKGLAVHFNMTVVAASNGIEIYRDGKRVTSKKVDWDPLCVALSNDGTSAAIGGKDGKIHIFSIVENEVTEDKVLTAKGQVICVSYSPDGKFLATGDSGRNVLLWSLPTYEAKIVGWVFHSAKVNCLSWSPNGQYVASGGLDTNVFVWDTQNPTKRIQIKNAHVASVNTVGWLSDDLVVSGGQDSAIKTWSISR